MNEFPCLHRDDSNNILRMDVDRSFSNYLSEKSIHWEFLLHLMADSGKEAQHLLSDKMMEEAGPSLKLLTCF